MYKNEKIKILNKYVYIETGKIAKNTLSSIFIEENGTALLVTIVQKENCEGIFFPLKVDYFERYYASGKIPGGYSKREGRASDREVLISRLIDRSIRPMFPKDFQNEVHITVTVLSINKEVNPDILAIIGTSIALSISGLPFEPIAAIRIGYNNKFLIHPETSELNGSKLDLVVSGTKTKIVMIEANCKEISESLFFSALHECKTVFDEIINQINEFKNGIDIKKVEYESYLNTECLVNIEDLQKIKEIYTLNDEKEIKEKFEILKATVLGKQNNESINRKKISSYVQNIGKNELRNKILKSKKRLDNRNFEDIRNISIDINFLKNTHGSALFTRGETQAIVSTTLGIQKDAQSVDCVFYENQLFDFMLHYNFPSYAVNEIGGNNTIKRREIGHGNLAKKALENVIPDKETFPYVIRLVSEITESNGSSSMATICGGSLSLMATGVPIKQHVAGIAMGIILEENDIAILTDISGSEDDIGDMDFKISGTKDGITALQMDMKIPGIDLEIIEKIVKQAKDGIKQILQIMNSKINKPLDRLSTSVPKIRKIKIDKEQIKNIIGKNGVIIKSLVERYDCKIDINEEGIVLISSKYEDNINNVIEEIDYITKEIEIGAIFKGKVIKLTQFGAFVNIKDKKDGLLHITKI